MNKDSFLYRVYDLYVDGFRHMTLGKTLWAVIAVKLVIIFLVLKVYQVLKLELKVLLSVLA